MGMSLINAVFGRKQEAPSRQLSLDELIERLKGSQHLRLKTQPHTLRNVNHTTVASGIEVTTDRYGIGESPYLGEFAPYHLGASEGLSLSVYLPVGLHDSRGRTIDGRLVEELSAIGAIRSGQSNLLPKTVPPGFATRKPGWDGNYYVVTVEPDGRLVCPT